MLNIPSAILGFTGQCVKGFKIEDDSNDAIIQCRRDHRFNTINPQTGEQGSTLFNYASYKVRCALLIGI